MNKKPRSGRSQVKKEQLDFVEQGQLKKIIMVILWDKSGILLNGYLPGGSTISSPSYASTIERLHCAIVEKSGGNAPVDKCNIVQAAI